jgi:hypothetical protein
MYVFGVYEHI